MIKDETDDCCGAIRYRWGHLAITYTALATLITLGDDLSRVDRKAIVDGKPNTQINPKKKSQTKFIYFPT